MRLVLLEELYRLFILKTLNKSWHRHQVQTVRWRLCQIAGKIVFHGGQVYLKVRRRFCQLFNNSFKDMGICKYLEQFIKIPPFGAFKGKDMPKTSRSRAVKRPAGWTAPKIVSFAVSVSNVAKIRK